MTKKRTRLYGVNPVRESLLADRTPPEKIYLLSGRQGGMIEEIRRLARKRRTPLLAAERDLLTRLAGTDKHQGVVAFLSPEGYYRLDGLLAEGKRKGTPPFLFLVDGVVDPRNLGAIIRTVDAAGGDGVVIPSRRAAGVTAVAAKTSAGASAHLPVARVPNLAAAAEKLKQAGVWIVGLDTGAETCYLDYDFRTPVAIVVGGEGQGMRRLMRQSCDLLLSLPMRGHVASLNVSVAVGIVAYEVVRQREGKR